MRFSTTLAGWLGAAALARVRPPEPEERKSETHGPGGLFLTGLAQGTAGGGRSYAALSAAGFMGNPVVHRAVRMVAEATAAMPLLLYEADREVLSHPLLDLLARPGPQADGAGFIEAISGHLLLSGNAFVEAVGLEGEPRGLHALRPDLVRVIADENGWPARYEHRVGGRTRRLAAESAQGGPGPVLHLKLFHPLDEAGGFAPLAAAREALDLHNAALEWNRALLRNSARPSGALIYRPPEGGHLTSDQFARLKTELDADHSGAARAGRPMLLEGGLDWKAMALSPKEMDFVEARHGAARDLALAFGVPPMLLGIPGDATYANYAEANRAFYRLTVLPFARRITSALGTWLGAHFGEPALRLEHDLDRVEGLGAERDGLWQRLGAADFLTREEKREAVGYGPDRQITRRPSR